MKKPVWHNQEKGTARATFVAFSAGRDVTGLPMADEILIPYDIWTNQAHAKMLYKVGVYSSEECQQVIQALNELKRQWENSNWRLDPAYEDVHINIEAYIAEVCGEGIGGKLHSGRSRNDQVATDMKLYARDALISLVEETVFLITALVELAKDHLQTVMPGYTHHRKATLTSWAHWCAAYAQALYRDAVRMRELCERINTCPLGAAASFGTTWPIDRNVTADLLAFRAIQENTLDAVMARGEAEWEIVQAASVLLKHLSCFSQDLILFSTEEFGYLGLPAAFTTGSSIMPQKRNPDFAEAIKAKAHAVQGYAQALGGINTANLFGYNKDVQWTKYQFMDAMRETRNAAEILSEVLPNLVVHADLMEKAARTGFLNAVDVADYLAQSRAIPFRETYKLISDAVGKSAGNQFELSLLNELLEEQNTQPLTDEEFQKLSEPILCLETRDHIGSPHPTQVKNHLANLSRHTVEVIHWIRDTREEINKAQMRCSEPTE